MPRPRIDAPHLRPRRGVLEIVWYEGGQRRRVSTGTADPVRAGQALADFEAELERRPLKLTVAEALERYIKKRTDKVEALDRLQDAAKALEAGQLGPKIGRLGDLRVDQVNQDHWDRYAAGRVTKPRGKQTLEKLAKHKPKPVAAGTLRREFNVLRAALRRAWKDGFLAKPPELEAPADSNPRDRYLTKAEARKLVAACITPHVKTFVALAV